MTLAIARTFLDQLPTPETPRLKLLRSVASNPRKTPPPRQNLSSLFAFEPLTPSTTNLASDTRAQARTFGEPANSAALRDALEPMRLDMGKQHDRWR